MFVTPPDLTVSSHFHFLHRCKICRKPENVLLRLGAWHKLVEIYVKLLIKLLPHRCFYAV